MMKIIVGVLITATVIGLGALVIFWDTVSEHMNWFSWVMLIAVLVMLLAHVVLSFLDKNMGA